MILWELLTDMNSHRFLIVVLVALSSAVLCVGQAHAYPEMERVMLEMSDGIRLATDIYYPQNGDGPWPVLLFRTPYGITTDYITWAAASGYVGVNQDTRGRFDSEGLDRLWLDDGWGPDHEDGRETMDWIHDQPWCDGSVGTVGSSARGITQNMLAGALPQGLACQHVSFATASGYHHTFFPGGALRRQDIISHIEFLGSTHMLDSLVAHPNYDEYWTYLDTETRDPLITVPTFQLGGWYDLFAEGQIAKFLGLQFNGGPGALGNQKLIMGAWGHGAFVGELIYPENAERAVGEALVGSMNSWLNYWLRGIPNGVMDLPSIAYYVMGDVDDPGAPGNEWRTGENWPPASVVDEMWYLHEDGALDRSLPESWEAPVGYAFDPYDPVPTLGGATLIGETGPHDQSPIEGRPDVVLYTSEMLTAPITICGPVRLILHASSDRLDTDFTAKLSDVYPDGRSMLVCDGIIRARHRISMADEDLLVPGQVYEFEILVGNTALCFNQGHRIRLAISSSNFARFDINPNTGGPFALEYPEMLVANNTLYNDAAYPSHLILPVEGGATSVDHATSVEGLHLLSASSLPGASLATIRFRLDSQRHVQVDIFDVRGRRQKQLVDAVMLGGDHTVTWNTGREDGQTVSSGVYFVRIASGGARTGAKLLVLR